MLLKITISIIVAIAVFTAVGALNHYLVRTTPWGCLVPVYATPSKVTLYDSDHKLISITEFNFPVSSGTDDSDRFALFEVSNDKVVLQDHFGKLMHTWTLPRAGRIYINSPFNGRAKFMDSSSAYVTGVAEQNTVDQSLKTAHGKAYTFVITPNFPNNDCETATLR